MSQAVSFRVREEVKSFHRWPFRVKVLDHGQQRLLRPARQRGRTALSANGVPRYMQVGANRGWTLPLVVAYVREVLHIVAPHIWFCTTLRHSITQVFQHGDGAVSGSRYRATYGSVNCTRGLEPSAATILAVASSRGTSCMTSFAGVAIACRCIAELQACWAACATFVKSGIKIHACSHRGVGVH